MAVVRTVKRLAVTIGLLLLLFVAGFAGAWLWMRLRHIEAQRAAVPTPAAVPTAPPSPTVPSAAAAEPAATPPTGYRLAGVALGAPNSFAVVEDPLGKSGLYRVGDPIDGLGRLRTIEVRRVVVDGTDGVVELQLAPAPTVTRAAAAPAMDTPGAAVTPTRPRRVPAADRVPESAPSDDPDQPAS